MGSLDNPCLKRILCSDDKCELCFNKSFASHDKAKYWSPKNIIKPRNVFKYSNKKFLFNCDSCGLELEMNLNNVASGKWCKSCGFKKTKEKQSMSLEEFIKRSKEKFGDQYDYTKTKLDGVDRPVTIYCNVHECEFSTTPYRHYSYETGCCPECAKEKRIDSKKYSFDEFLEMANRVHENKFDYESARKQYVNLDFPISIVCKLHGEFTQLPSVHLISKCGCTKCGRESTSLVQRLTTEEFIKRSKLVHGDIYDYSKTIYTNQHQKVTIICMKHGDFEQDPSNHMNGVGCRRCTYICCLDDFIQAASIKHNKLYDYSLVDYENSHKAVKIKCKDCGIFEQTPNSHLRGSGCPSCINKTEKKLYTFLKEKYNDIVKEYKPEWLTNETTGRRYRFDFFIPSLNIIIELDGGQHFKQVLNWLDPFEQTKKDIWKMNQANSNNIYVVRLLQEDVYKYDNSWLEHHLLPELIKRDSNMFITSEERSNMYDIHIELFENE
jgi:very-short-patch-repair endonuclease